MTSDLSVDITAYSLTCETLRRPWRL